MERALVGSCSSITRKELPRGPRRSRNGGMLGMLKSRKMDRGGKSRSMSKIVDLAEIYWVGRGDLTAAVLCKDT